VACFYRLYNNSDGGYEMSATNNNTKEILDELKNQLMKSGCQKDGNSLTDCDMKNDLDNKDNITLKSIMEKLEQLNHNQLKMMALLTEINYKMRR
jgi:hypothetical protein